MTQFPKDFLFGAATAAHQVEGNNTNSDYWTLEQVPGSDFAEPSLDAVDHYHPTGWKARKRLRRLLGWRIQTVFMISCPSARRREMPGCWLPMRRPGGR